jgi:imidazolonepropionase-like amidohydrolase
MRLHALLAAALVVSTGCEKAADSAAGETLLIRDVTLISPERDEAAPSMDVLIRDGRIEEIAPDIKASAGAEIDGGGKFLIPGLIDGHVHLGSPPGMNYEDQQNHPDVAEALTAQTPKSFLFYGFTTVVDLIATPEQIADWNNREIRPQAYFCGAAPIIDGYPSLFIPQSVRYDIMPNFLVEEGAAPDGVDPANHTPEAVAERVKSAGAVCVKTFYEDGFGARSDWPTPSADLIRGLVAAAHARGMPVILHANAQDSQRFGVETGVDAFAHGMWTWDDNGQTSVTPSVAALLDEQIAKGIASQPTFQVLYAERDIHDPDYLKQDALRDALPQSAIDWYASEAGQAVRNEIAASDWMQEILATEGFEAIDAEPIARVKAATEYLLAHDGELFFGSDTPSDLTFANPPGLNGRIELGRWAEAGATPDRILRAATIDAARFFGLDGEIGTVEAGKRADLLLLDENPLESINAFDTIKFVIVNGKASPRETLSARYEED